MKNLKLYLLYLTIINLSGCSFKGYFQKPRNYVSILFEDLATNNIDSVNNFICTNGYLILEFEHYALYQSEEHFTRRNEIEFGGTSKQAYTLFLENGTDFVSRKALNRLAGEYNGMNVQVCGQLDLEFGYKTCSLGKLKVDAFVEIPQ